MLALIYLYNQQITKGWGRGASIAGLWIFRLSDGRMEDGARIRESGASCPPCLGGLCKPFGLNAARACTEGCDLDGDEAPYIHNHPHTLDLKSFTITTFDRRGGGGRGCPEAKQWENRVASEKTKRRQVAFAHQASATLRAAALQKGTYGAGWGI